jgi:DNA-binding NarL/FixJ family response regulator
MVPSRRLLVVEDEPLVAALLQEALSGAGFTVVAAHSAAEAKKAAKDFDPDIAVLDINLGSGANGIDLAFVLQATYPGIALVILTKHPDLRTAGFSKNDLPPGCGFLRKDLIRDSKHIVSAIEEVIAKPSNVRQDSDPQRPLAKLTSAQIEVLRMLSQGHTNAAIAAKRGTSIRATEQLINLVYLGLGIPVDGDINPRVEATRLFINATGMPDRQ